VAFNVFFLHDILIDLWLCDCDGF